MATAFVIVKVSPAQQVDAFLLKDGSFGMAGLNEIEVFYTEADAEVIARGYSGVEVVPVEWSVHLK